MVLFTHTWEDKGVHTFPKGICLKGNVKRDWSTNSLTTIPQSIALTISPRGHPHSDSENISGIIADVVVGASSSMLSSRPRRASKELVFVIKITCGTNEARAIEFMFWLPLFLILSRVVFDLSVLTIKNSKNGTLRTKFPV